MNDGFPLREIRQQLEQAKNADPELKVFGAKKHQYHLNPPATEDAVVRFEEKIGVQLPTEYRKFLLQAGNGGAGPFYGLFSLEQVEYWLTWEVEPDELPLLYPERSGKTFESEGEAAFRGCIPIESEGDTYFTYLLVTGPDRGRVLYIEYEGSWVFFPRETSFLSWYQRWLREVCNHYESLWFGTELDGDEAQLQAYYEHAQAEDDKLYAIKSMKKFPVLSKSTTAFLEKAIWERRNMEDARGFLSLIHRVSPEFFRRFMDSRWQAGLYDAVVWEIQYAISISEQEEQVLAERWWKCILEKLPDLAPDTQLSAVSVLQKSKVVRMSQLIWLFKEETNSNRKQKLLTLFSGFGDAAQNMDFWLEILEEREDLDLLNSAIIRVPKLVDNRLKESIARIQQEFRFAVELILHVDRGDPEARARADRRIKENEVYHSACRKWKALWYEEANPVVLGIPRPYRLEMHHCDRTNLFLDREPPKNGTAVHPFIALVIQEQFHCLPSTVYDWEKIFGKIKRLKLELTSTTVRNWDDEGRTVEIVAADDYPLPNPFYYSLEDWSAIGRMKNLKTLIISEICVEDFSFLKECQSVTQLSLYNTNFTDCRLLLQMSKLKHVDLRLCHLEYLEVLKDAPFSYQLQDG